MVQSGGYGSGTIRTVIRRDALGETLHMPANAEAVENRR